MTRSSLVCKATCCGSQSRAPFRRPGSGSQCMRKIERRLSMNRAPCPERIHHSALASFPPSIHQASNPPIQFPPPHAFPFLLCSRTPKTRLKRCIIRDRRVFLNPQPCFNGLHDRQRKNRPTAPRPPRRIEPPHGRRPNRQRTAPMAQRIAASQKLLAEPFAGRPVSKQNLSEWKAGLPRRSLLAKAGGHRLWLAGRETLTPPR